MSLVFETKRPLTASRFTRIPSTAEDVSMLRAKAFVRLEASFR